MSLTKGLTWLFQLMLITGLMVVVAWISYRVGFRQGQQTYQPELDSLIRREIVRETETVRAKLGRSPLNQAELEALLGHPMPCVHEEGKLVSIDYRRTGENSFQLQYELWATDDWTYGSTNPEAGWVQSWY